MDAFDQRFNGQGSALQLVKMIAETFPSFRDEVMYNGRKGAVGCIIGIFPTLMLPCH